ncbi:hypothetical protein MXB_4601, partial [Myxobolus squamalis]
CNNGHIFVFDHLGYLFFKYTKLKTAIKKVSIDDPGDYILIIIVGMISNDQYTFEFEKEISAASMPSNFSKRNIKCVIACCNKRILLAEKKIFGNSKTLIFTSEESCQIIKWHKNFVAWANFIVYYVYNYLYSRHIFLIWNHTN